LIAIMAAINKTVTVTITWTRSFGCDI